MFSRICHAHCPPGEGIPWLLVAILIAAVFLLVGVATWVTDHQQMLEAIVWAVFAAGLLASAAVFGWLLQREGVFGRRVRPESHHALTVGRVALPAPHPAAIRQLEAPKAAITRLVLDLEDLAAEIPGDDHG